MSARGRGKKSQLERQATVKLTSSQSQESVSSQRTISSTEVKPTGRGARKAKSETVVASSSAESASSKASPTKRRSTSDRDEAQEKASDAKRRKKQEKPAEDSNDEASSQATASNDDSAVDLNLQQQETEHKEEDNDSSMEVDEEQEDDDNQSTSTANLAAVRSNLAKSKQEEVRISSQPVPRSRASARIQSVNYKAMNAGKLEDYPANTQTRTQYQQTKVYTAGDTVGSKTSRETLHTYSAMGTARSAQPPGTTSAVEKARQPKSRMILNIIRNCVSVFVMILIAIVLAIVASTYGQTCWKLVLEQLGQLSVVMPSSPVSDKSSPKESSLSTSKLHTEFPTQTARLWSILEAATLPVIEEDNPVHPAVILLVAPSGNQHVAKCLAQRFAALVTDALAARQQHAVFNCESYAKSDPDDAKKQLDTVISGAFEAGSKSAVVLDIEKLPGPAAMIFYRLADNDNAPYKKVAIILTLTLQSTDAGSERDNVAYEELRKVWGSTLDTDKVEPLLSRIGNSVAFVHPESTETMSALKC